MEVPTVKPPKLPTVSEGKLYDNMGRYAGRVVMTVFEMIGGAERMAAWAEANPTEFYTKLYPKVIAKPAAADGAGALQSLESLIRQLDAKTINGEVVDG